ncbi:MAG TPA: CPBP family intramembrane glutamic endopeptidase [Pyrinomonadaceae bacterium]|nr:CPBP family intramembrane glutamic endopeptidase [Pyrinomonadaceae bacterium]
MSTPPETAYSAPPIYSPALADLPATHSSVDPENPPWSVLWALITWFLSFAALALVPVLCVQPYVAQHYRSGPAPTQEILLADKTFVFLFVLGWVPAHLLTLALIWAVATRLGKYSLKEVFGLSWSPTFRLGKSVGVAILLFVMAWLIAALFGAHKTDLDQILESSRAAALTLAFIAVATAPLVEELTYRGLLYSAMQRVIGRWFAVLVVASMFAGLHVYQYRQNIGAILSISLLSLVLTAVRARTGRLLPCVVIHLVFNGVQSLIIVLEPYLRALAEHWRPQPTTGLLIFIVRLLC